MRKPIDGMAAAKTPVNSSSGRIDGERTGSTSESAWPMSSETAVAPTTVTPRTTVIACSVGTVG